MSVADIFDALPEDWFVDVTIRRGGGRDRYGNPLPEVELTAHRVLLGWRATAEPLDFSDLTDDRGTLYAEDEPGIDWRSDDRIVIPTGYKLDGGSETWAVDGRPAHWPIGGWEVAIRKEPSA